ncbi:hypothetical protein ACFB49_46420 [Sphingomonas sp. DBB INV C78]|uniref:YncE family protein n=1 Tax=Sphingomonas sp. DBB INV C78 TaxID=3349434 RepID=UPI0036D21A96
MKQSFSASVMLAVTMLAGCAKSEADKAAAPATPVYQVVDRIKGADGKYDYASVDSAANRLFVGRGYGVMTVDLATNEMRTLIERDNVAAVLLIPGTNLLLSTNAETNNATLLDRTTGAVQADIPTGRDPDGALFDAQSGLAFVMNGDSEDITLIDIATATAVATIPAGGKPEAATSNGKGRAFVNIEDANAIAVIDIAARKVATRYPLAGCNEPTGIAYDAATNLLISVCHNNIARLVDADTGADRGSFAVGAGADGVLFDADKRIGFVPCIDGTLTVFALDAKGKATVLQTIKTADGARTAAYDAKTGRLYLPAATVERDDKGEYLTAARDFSIVVVAPR